MASSASSIRMITTSRRACHVMHPVTKRWHNYWYGSFSRRRRLSVDKQQQQQPRPSCWLSSSSSLSSREADAGELQSIYSTMVQKGEIKEDIHQLKAIQVLDQLRQELLAQEEPPATTTRSNSDSSSSPSFLGGLFGKKTKPASSTVASLSNESPKGVYLHGGVGCGKTFVMNLFYDSITPEVSWWGEDKQHVHFHKFMLGVHQQMHESKMIERIEGDVLPRVIERTLERGRLLCFDEFQVTDVADALILQRLFTGLLEQGAVVVATSNRPPCDLYLNGLQRDRFIPFIDLLYEKLRVVSMWDSETDYRLIQAETKAKGVYFVGKDRTDDFDDVFHKLIKGAPTNSTSLSTQGRLVPVPVASLEHGIARFSFEDLCKKALGAADYLVIGQHFHTVFVDDIPAMTRDELNWVRRFIVFVDAMYECHVKLILHAATPIDGIFQVDLTEQHIDEVFAFDRTRSRLEEMGSDAYLEKRWAGLSKDELKVKLLLEPSLSEDVVEHHWRDNGLLK